MAIKLPKRRPRALPGGDQIVVTEHDLQIRLPRPKEPRR